MNNPFAFAKPLLDLLEPYREGDEDDFTLENFLKLANNGAALEKLAEDFDYAAWLEVFHGLLPEDDFPREVACFVDMWLRAWLEQREEAAGIEELNYERIGQREQELLKAMYPDNELDPTFNSNKEPPPDVIAKIMMGSKELCERLDKEGLSKEFATELVELVNEFNFETQLVFQEEVNRFAWKHSLSKAQIVPFHHISLLHFALLIESGELKSVKRCELEDCRKFHNRRGKWCSDNCGSTYRGRMKRERDRGSDDEFGIPDRWTDSFFYQRAKRNR
jgi:hypothetical protein